MNKPVNRLLASLVMVSGSCLGCASELDSLSPNALHGASVTSLAWMSGEWASGDDQSGSWTYLSCPRGDMLLGLQHDQKKGATRFFEFLRYQAVEDGVMFLAQPRGAEATGFVMISSEPNHAVFENVMHDFPQRIAMSLDGDILTGTISGIQNGESNSSSWTWQRRGSAPDCGP